MMTRKLVPDVVFSDISMPGMNGLLLAAALKRVVPDTQIVLVTAYSEYALEAWKKHVQGFLVKPVTAEDIRDAISYLRATLAEIGMGDVLIRERRQIAVRRSLIDCDYYRMLEGNIAAVNTYRGEYMPEYSWAETTAARLEFQH